MKSAAGAALIICVLAGFSCPSHEVTELVILPMGPHHYYETDTNGLLTFEREVFVPGDTATPTVLGRQGRSSITLNRSSLRFASSAPDVATVSATGTVTARSVGDARILVGYESVSDTFRVVVVPRAAELRLVLDPATIRVGSSSHAVATAFDANGTPFPRTYYNLQVSPATIADGLVGAFTVTGRGAGTASVSASLIGQDLQARASLTVTP